MKIAHCVLLVVLILTARSQHVATQQLACSTIQPGETVAHAARRITGDARNRHVPWFQIVDPTVPRFIAKAEYDRVRPGWRACVVNEPVKRVSRGGLAGTPVASFMEMALAGVPRVIGGVDVTFILWVALGIATFLIWNSIDEYLTERKARVAAMKRFGERFVREFERPLFQPHLPGCPIQSQLRASPHRGRLEILLAPAGGKCYPNLSDHKRNVAYDVTRVLQLLQDPRFVCGPLHARGAWVVVPFQLQISASQAGVK